MKNLVNKFILILTLLRMGCINPSCLVSGAMPFDLLYLEHSVSVILNLLVSRHFHNKDRCCTLVACALNHLILLIKLCLITVLLIDMNIVSFILFLTLKLCRSSSIWDLYYLHCLSTFHSLQLHDLFNYWILIYYCSDS